MDTFDQSVQAIEDQRDAPVRAEREKLAPARAELVKGLEAHRRMAAKVRPRLAAASAKLRRASAALGRHASSPLYQSLEEAERNMTGGEGSYLDAIARIDQLDAYTVYQRGHTDLANKPAMCRANTGALEEMVKRVEWNVKEMEEALQNMVPSSPAAIAVAHREPPAAIPVASTFDPRRT